jgi:hypothetical protein
MLDDLRQQLKEQEIKYEIKLKDHNLKAMKLEEKLETKDGELIQLKADLGATNILQKQLKEKEDKIEKLNAELHEARKDTLTNPHE